MYKNIVLPASILAGTIIGAGIFSLPFVFQQAGLLSGLFYLIFFALLFALIYLFYADLIIRTPGEHRFVGYADIYLGRWGFWAAIFMNLVFLLFTLAIYLILAPSFSKLFIADGSLCHLLGFWILGSTAILFSTKRIALAEFFITAGICLIILLVFVLGIGGLFEQGNLKWLPPDLSNFLVVGPILFSLAGAVAVPEIVSYFRESKIPLGYLKKSLIFGTAVPTFVYFLFIIGVISLSVYVSEDAVSGLISNVPLPVLAAIGILGFLSLISSYIVIGLNVRRIFNYDLFLPNWLSKLLVIFIPISLYFAGFRNFIESVSFVGKFFLPLEVIFILLIWIRANRKAEMPPLLVGRRAFLFVPVILAVFFVVLIYAII